MSTLPIFTPPAWPSGTSPWNTGWHRLEVTCDWLDFDALCDSICRLNSNDVTLEYRFVAKFDFDDELTMFKFFWDRDDREKMEWDTAGRFAQLDPCEDPDAMDQWVDAECPAVWLSMGAIFAVDVRNEATYRRLVVGIEKSQKEFRGMAPLIEFLVR
jgi:hypothetical protein